MKKIIRNKFDLFAEWVGDNLGKPVAFSIALAGVLIWAACGPFAHYSETWQLIINTATTIATFLMVFLLQNTQNRDTQELHDRLEELHRLQNLILELERKHGERIAAIEYQLDKSDSLS